MKKLILFFFCLGAVSSSFGQLPPDPDEFARYMKENGPAIYQEIGRAYENKDYRELIAASRDLAERFERLLPVDRAAYLSELSQAYYALACGYSMTGKKKQALDALEKAVENGFFRYQHVLNDEDLDNIRNHPRFKAVLEIMKQRGDLLAFLQRAGGYSEINESLIMKDGRMVSQSKALPAFVYQPASDSNLVRVREYFKLDSVAGNGDEISKIKNLLLWAHNAVRHDGSYWSPEGNSIAIVDTCRATRNGANCRKMAIVLNECYLAMGFKSRFVTCMPKDPDDQDCHVINMVWSETLGKWLWMDPTFNAYLTDENGLLLSIAEVRERTIKGDPLILNQDANWNGEPRTQKWYIDTYMVKNMYWFNCQTVSGFGGDSNGSPVHLYPGGYSIESDTSPEWYYITTNADYFWQHP